MRSVPFQRLKLANFDIYGGNMGMDRCWEMTSNFTTLMFYLVFLLGGKCTKFWSLGGIWWPLGGQLPTIVNMLAEALE